MNANNNHPRLSFSSLIYAVTITTWFIDKNWDKIDVKNHPLQFCWNLAIYAILWSICMEFIESCMPNQLDIIFPIAISISAGITIGDLLDR
jgi:hypothetical protein